MACRAPERRFDDPGPDFRGFAKDPFNGNEGVDIVGPDVADPGLFGEVGEADVDPFRGFLPLLGADQLVVLYRVPDILENFPRVFEEFVSKSDAGFSEPFDIAVVDVEGTFVGVSPGRSPPSPSCTASLTGGSSRRLVALMRGVVFHGLLLTCSSLRSERSGR